MGVIAKGIPRGCQGLFTPVSLGYPLSVFNKNSTLNRKNWKIKKEDNIVGARPTAAPRNGRRDNAAGIMNI